METNSFSTIQPWIKEILSVIKKDIKTDHLPGDPSFCRKHFGSRPIAKLTQDEIFAAYEAELLGNNQALAEWVVNRWVFKNGDVYRFFAERLSAINPNFQELKSLTEDQAEQVLAGAADAFGAVTAYIFSRLNGVVFPETVFQKLFKAAQIETQEKIVAEEQKDERETFEQMRERHNREMSRLKEKYEDRLSGVLRKYGTDVEALKKQIRALQQAKNP